VTEKIITIHQPDFFPWLGFFDRWKKADLYIMLDDVQFLRRGWHHRDKIKTQSGVSWFTVPIVKKGKYSQLINEAEIDNNTNWRSKCLNTIYFNYKKAPNFEYCYEKIEGICNKKYQLLIDLNKDIMDFAALELGIDTPTVFSSKYDVKSTSTQRLVDLVRLSEGTTYLTGLGSKDYLDESIFNDEGVKVDWCDFQHPVYEQLYGDFIPGLSCLDFLMMRAKN
jgi:hypothetical protein